MVWRRKAQHGIARRGVKPHGITQRGEAQRVAARRKDAKHPNRRSDATGPQQQPKKLTTVKRPNDAGQSRLTGPSNAPTTPARAGSRQKHHGRGKARGMARPGGKDGIPRYPRIPRSSKDNQMPQTCRSEQGPERVERHLTQHGVAQHGEAQRGVALRGKKRVASDRMALDRMAKHCMA